MCMRLTGIGSQYIIAYKDADGNDPRRRAELPSDTATRHPGSTVLVADRLRHRDALDASDAAALPASREPGLPDAGRDRERRRLDDHHVRPGAARGQPEGNWIQTTEGKGWFLILRLYSPLQPFFDKSWRPSEIEEVT